MGVDHEALLDAVDGEIQKRGWRTLYDFLLEHPRASYVELAKLLHGRVMPVQIARAQRRAALKAGMFKTYAMDSLLRDLHGCLGRGWRADKESRFDNIEAYALWVSRLGLGEKAGDDTPLAVWRRIEGATPPDGWLPESTEDPVLKRAFDPWPESLLPNADIPEP